MSFCAKIGAVLLLVLAVGCQEVPRYWGGGRVVLAEAAGRKLYAREVKAAITSVVVFCVGIFGSIFGEWILRRCGVRDAEARGFALGAAAHGIGTARAIEIGAVEGALSGLAMALMGLATALLMPLMERYLY